MSLEFLSFLKHQPPSSHNVFTLHTAKADGEQELFLASEGGRRGGGGSEDSSDEEEEDLLMLGVEVRASGWVLGG